MVPDTIYDESDLLTLYRLVLRPRVFRDVSEIDTTTTLFGKQFGLPVGISPTAMQKLVGGEGEIDVAKAVVSRETLMILSTNSTSRLEEVINASGRDSDHSNFWFQLYVSQDRDKCAKLIKRVESEFPQVISCP